MNADASRSRMAFVWVGVVVPAAIILLAAIVIVGWLPQIPEPAATHWGIDGVDGFGPGWTYLVITLGLGGGIIALFSLTVLLGNRSPRRGAQWSPTARLLGATSLAVPAGLAMISLIGVGAQRGLDDAADAPDITAWMLLSLLAMAALALLGWFVQPRTRADEDPGEAADPLTLADSERAVWIGTAATARSGQIVLGISVFLVLALSVILGATGVEGWWLSGIVGVLLAVLTATMLVFRVRATSAGLTVRSAAGWPRFTIPADRIASVRVVDINPLGEFGGWGYRIGTDGRRGVVVRSGEALQVTQTTGKVFVVTVDDAGSAASLLAAAANRDGGAA